MKSELIENLRNFFDKYPFMSIVSINSSGLYLKGTYSFKAICPGYPQIEDSYELEIIIPDSFPNDLIKVKELEGKIPRNGDYHVNKDGSLCLGSPLRLLINTNCNRNLFELFEKTLTPYLYAVSYKIRNGGPFIFGELKHGKNGIFEDYSNIFGINDPQEIARTLVLLSMKRGRANKRPCPCGCGKMLGDCKFHLKLNEIREMSSSNWFNKIASDFNQEIALKRRV